MKLRNKKTGEIFDALIREKGGGGSYSLIVCDIKAYEQSKSTLDATHFVLEEYDSLAKLNDDWEDYKPAEPLIKDPKIRKAVRAWAEANGFEPDYTVRHYSTSFALTSWQADIEFNEYIEDLEEGKEYSIEELCGEDEE